MSYRGVRPHVGNMKRATGVSTMKGTNEAEDPIMEPHHAMLPLWDDRAPDERIESLRALVLDLYGYVLREPTESMLQLLASHACEDDSESRSVVLMRQMIASIPNILAPNCETGHVTGSALVIDVPAQKVLLMHHRKLDRWLQMGGHGNFEVSPAAIALREAREESGLEDLAFLNASALPDPFDVDVHIISMRSGMPEHYHLDFRYLLVTSTPHLIRRREAEANELRWFAFDEVERLELDAPTMRLIRKAHRFITPV